MNDDNIVDLLHKFKEVKKDVIEYCFEAGYNMHKSVLNNRIIHSLQKLEQKDENVVDKIKLILSLADGDEYV